MFFLSLCRSVPRVEHWDAALCVVRYLKGSPGQGIILRDDNDLLMQGWCDYVCAACPINSFFIRMVSFLGSFSYFLEDQEITYILFLALL